MEKLITNPVRYAKEMLAGITKYALGKGVVSLGVMLATFASGGATAAILPVVAGFIGWKMYRLYDGYVSYKDRMLDMYRDEIGRELGMDPSAVTRDHLRVMARGDAVLGVEPNPIIAEALNRQRGWALLSFCTAILAAGVTLGLLSMGMDNKLGEWMKSILPIGERTSLAAISGLSGLIVHNGLDAVVGQSLGFFRATAHDRIALIVRQKEYGVKVTAQQVFDVFLAANPEFARQVSATFNKGITGFTPNEKMAAMKAIGIDASMQELADQINKGELKPGTLAFELDSTHVARSLHAKTGMGFERSHAQSPELAREEAPSKRFADRLVPRSETGSFVEAEQQRRDLNAQRLHQSI